MPPPGDLSLPPEFDDLEIGVTLHDPESGAILDVNDRLERLYGYAADELREMTVGDYTPGCPAYAEKVARHKVRSAAEGEIQVFEWRVERASGELLWVRCRLNATTIDGWECVFAEIRDVTEYKGRERRLRLLNRVIRHNLRNETNVLLGYVDRLQSVGGSPAVEEEVERVEAVATDIGRLSESVRQIEEIVDPDATERSPMNVAELAREIVADARAEHPHAELTLDVEEEVWVNGDVGLEYAIGHAVENAIEHNDREGPTVTVSVGRGAATGRAFVAVADDGPAIPEIEIEALDADTTTTSTSHGAGLGLWVMNWCVDALGGELSFEANEPRGNVVRLSLPAAHSPEAGGRRDRER